MPMIPAKSQITTNNPFPLPAMESNSNTKHTARNANQPLYGAVHVEPVPLKGDALARAPLTITTAQGGKPYRTEYHERLDALRRDLSNCGRCGRPNANGSRQCDLCRDYARQYKARQRGESFTPSQAAGMILQMRRELSRLRATVKNMANDRRASYSKGYRSGYKTALVAAKYGDTLPEISNQEAASICHAYDNEENQ